MCCLVWGWLAHIALCMFTGRQNPPTTIERNQRGQILTFPGVLAARSKQATCLDSQVCPKRALTQRGRDSRDWALLAEGQASVVLAASCQALGSSVAVCPGLPWESEGRRQCAGSGVSGKNRLSGCSWLQFEHTCLWGLTTQGTNGA